MSQVDVVCSKHKNVTGWCSMDIFIFTAYYINLWHFYVYCILHQPVTFLSLLHITSTCDIFMFTAYYINLWHFMFTAYYINLWHFYVYCILHQPVTFLCLLHTTSTCDIFIFTAYYINLSVKIKMSQVDVVCSKHKNVTGWCSMQ